MTDPRPPLTGWQYVILEIFKMAVPIVLALAAIRQSNRADDEAKGASAAAAQAQHTADLAHARLAAKN